MAVPLLAPPQRGQSGDSDVLISFVLVAAVVAVIALVQGGLLPLPWPPHSLKLRCIAAASIGAVVGFAELVSRYRDEPWQAAGSPPGIAYISR